MSVHLEDMENTPPNSPLLIISYSVLVEILRKSAVSLTLYTPLSRFTAFSLRFRSNPFLLLRSLNRIVLMIQGPVASFNTSFARCWILSS